jgi:hypothetical protein
VERTDAILNVPVGLACFVCWSFAARQATSAWSVYACRCRGLRRVADNICAVNYGHGLETVACSFIGEAICLGGCSSLTGMLLSAAWRSAGMVGLIQRVGTAARGAEGILVREPALHVISLPSRSPPIIHLTGGSPLADCEAWTTTVGSTSCCPMRWVPTWDPGRLLCDLFGAHTFPRFCVQSDASRTCPEVPAKGTFGVQIWKLPYQVRLQLRRRPTVDVNGRMLCASKGSA